MKTDMLKYENSLWNIGIKLIAGIDEVGRGCIAGPLVTAAVAWNKEFVTTSKDSELQIINDSKKLTEKKRNYLSDYIKKNAQHYAIYEISSKEIDKNGVGEANKKALYEVANLIPNIEHILVDHFEIENYPCTPITKGDTLSLSIASASIIAKVYRDNLMKEKYHNLYPQYNFAKHVGYGTKAHIEAIKTYGYCEIHRRSYKLSI